MSFGKLLTPPRPRGSSPLKVDITDAMKDMEITDKFSGSESENIESCLPDRVNNFVRPLDKPPIGGIENEYHSHKLNNYNTSMNINLPRQFYIKANEPKTKRLVNVCQMYFLDYYYDLFDYTIKRKQRFEIFQKSIQDLSSEDILKQLKSYNGRERVVLRKKRIKPKHKDFQLITKVGQGGYGQVFLARKIDTKEVCALKVLDKRLLHKLNETRHVLTERDILTNTRSDWLVKLLYAFQDPSNVYLAMEFVPGGDYRTLLNNTGSLIPQHTRFYISEMFCAVNALHKLGFTHRDLKPENFLIDSNGHIKLTDFGLAAGSVSKERIESMKIKLNDVKDLQVPSRSIKERQFIYRSLRLKDINFASSIVGSPDYMALEVLEGRQYDYTIDYWSLGCMLFESLMGFPPFTGGTSEETYANLRGWKNSLRRPRLDGRYMLSDRTWFLITRLITGPNERIRSFADIKACEYFNDIDWENIREKRPPFIPQLDNDEDAGYFDDFENEKDMEKYKEVVNKQLQLERLEDKGPPQRSFVGFTFKHKGLRENSNSINKVYGNNRKDDMFTTLY